jgi:hypothetical protein
MNYEQIVIARSDNGFLVRGAEALRELRAPRSMGVPQVQGSRGLAGFAEGEQEQYLHLSGDDAWLAFAPTENKGAYLADANARVMALERTAAGTRLQLHSHVPLRLAIRHPTGCAVTLGGRRLTPSASSNGLHHYASDKDGTETLTIGCP